MRIVIDILLAVGFVFALAGTKGILQMPDTFCRMQASTCITTLGTAGVILGGALYAFFVMGSVSTGVKVLFIGLLIITINPIGSHAIAKGAYKNGVRPDKEMEIDDYGRDFNE
ncbi:MAG: monovalent cation/H(+) antiporter subunit G [Oscillospiraceae bacterium]|jgi:multicomponent Na+:H+ antiporter subunit G|nr:monovalent cation/H(+) antiporter subunit G [Oscillospiraceae bacterium]